MKKKKKKKKKLKTQKIEKVKSTQENLLKNRTLTTPDFDTPTFEASPEITNLYDGRENSKTVGRHPDKGCTKIKLAGMQSKQGKIKKLK